MAHHYWEETGSKKIVLDWKEIKAISTGLDSLLNQYHSLFTDELGTMKGVTAKLSVEPEAKPKFCRAILSAPYVLRESIEKDLNCLQKFGVLEKVTYSDLATPIILVPKPDGSERLCGDFKVTVNPVLQVDQHPIPKPEECWLLVKVLRAKFISGLPTDGVGPSRS